MPEAQVLDVQEFDYENEVLAREEEEAYRRYVNEKLKESLEYSKRPDAVFFTAEEVLSKLRRKLEERAI